MRISLQLGNSKSTDVFERRAYSGNDGYEHGGVLTVLVFVPVEPMSKENRDAETRVGLPPLLLAGNAPDR